MEIIHSPNAPSAIGPYSQAIVATGELVFCSGQIPIDPATGELVQGTAAEQTKQVMANLTAVLLAASCEVHDIAKTTIYLSNMDDFATVNEVYEEMMHGHRPARATVEVSRLPKSVAVEIDCIAIRGVRDQGQRLL